MDVASKLWLRDGQGKSKAQTMPRTLISVAFRVCLWVMTSGPDLEGRDKFPLMQSEDLDLSRQSQKTKGSVGAACECMGRAQCQTHSNKFRTQIIICGLYPGKVFRYGSLASLESSVMCPRFGRHLKRQHVHNYVFCPGCSTSSEITAHLNPVFCIS